MSQKVWVINPPRTDHKKAPSDPSGTGTAGSHARFKPAQYQAIVSDESPGSRWLRVVRAYLLGPFALTLWPRGRFRLAWAVAGAASMVAVVSLVAGRADFAAWIDSVPNGLLLWIAVVSAAFVTAATAWSRAVHLAGRDYPTLAVLSPNWLRRPRAVCALGMLVPGLGLLVAGYPRRAALLLWAAGPLALAIFTLSQWRWLWERGQSAVPPGISGPSLEIFLVAATGVVAVGLLTWIVQALDGARRVSSMRRSPAFANAVSLALLVSLALFSMTYRPVSLAQSLGAAAVALHRDGLRVIPLGLAEAAARLDPASPEYLAHAALLNDELGMKDAAQAKRDTLERRMKKYAELIRRDRETATLTYTLSPNGDRRTGRIAQPGDGDTWKRIQALPGTVPTEQ